MAPGAAARLIGQHFGDAWCAAFLGIGSTSPIVAYERLCSHRLGMVTRRMLRRAILVGFPLTLALLFGASFTLRLLPPPLMLFGLALLLCETLVSTSVIAGAGFLRIGLLGANIEVAENGDLYRSELLGRCPICAGGKVKLRSTPPSFGLDLVGVCGRNPNLHIFSFDNTRMSGESLLMELRAQLERARHESGA